MKRDILAIAIPGALSQPMLDGVEPTLQELRGGLASIAEW
jgi:hypothetical protein